MADAALRPRNLTGPQKGIDAEPSHDRAEYQREGDAAAVLGLGAEAVIVP